VNARVMMPGADTSWAVTTVSQAGRPDSAGRNSEGFSWPVLVNLAVRCVYGSDEEP
jgi:hypothetical protein